MKRIILKNLSNKYQNNLNQNKKRYFKMVHFNYFLQKFNKNHKFLQNIFKTSILIIKRRIYIEYMQINNKNYNINIYK
jgi:hypothetical protein